MKHTRTNQSETKIKLDVTLDAADLAATKSATLGRLAKKIKVSGFRPGKVPLSVAEKHLDQNALHAELSSDAISKFLADVLIHEQLQPLDRPNVAISAYVPAQSLEFTAEIEVIPEIKLGNYKKLKVKKAAVKVSDEAINAVVERMRAGTAKRQAVERPAQLGDEVVIDFVGTKDGQTVNGATGHDYPLTLGSQAFIPGFEEGIVGKRAGDVFDLPLTFPKDYHAQNLAGRQIVFTVTLKLVHELVLPELDDAFAAASGPFKDIAELKADIAKRLTEQKEHEALEAFKEELLEKLVSASTIPVPEILIADQVANLERDFTQNLLYRQTTLADYLADRQLTEETWRATELRDKAIKTVQIGLALSELRKLEKIELTTEELDQRWAALLAMYGADAKFRHQLETQEARRDFANRLLTEKTVDYLASLNDQ